MFLAIYQKMKLIRVLASIVCVSFLFIQCENKKSKREPKKNIVLSTSEEVNSKGTLKIGLYILVATKWSVYWKLW